MKRKSLPLFLALAMTLFLLPTAALADSGPQFIPVSCDQLTYLSYGLIPIRKGDKWGYIDARGQEVVPPTYDYAGALENGLGHVELDGKCGFVDATGKEVLAPIYDAIYTPVVGNRLVTYSDGLALARRGETWVYLDEAFREVFTHEGPSSGPFSEGLARVQLPGDPSQPMGFMDKTGEIVIPYVYQQVNAFVDGMALVEREHKWGYIDTLGNEVIPCQYDGLGLFFQDLAGVRIDGQWGFLDRTGALVVPPKYQQVNSFSEGLAAVKKDNKWGFIDQTGKEVIPCRYQAVSNFHDGRAKAKGPGDLYGYLDTAGKTVIPFVYDFAGDFNGGYAMVTTGVDELGQNGRHGLIDTNGGQVLPCVYDYLGVVDGNTVTARLNGEYGLVSLPAAQTAHPSTQTVLVDGQPVEFQCYALADSLGSLTNYVRLRDLAQALSTTGRRFDVIWDIDDPSIVVIAPYLQYNPNGTEGRAPFTGDRPYTIPTAPTKINRVDTPFASILLTDDSGGGHTYYRLRDLAQALNFNVGWSPEGAFIQTNNPYDPAD